MTTDPQAQQRILHPVEWDKFYEYQVERQGKLYIAGVNNARLSCGDVLGDVFLDKIVEQEAILWTPKLLHPLQTKKIKRNIRENQFTVNCSLTYTDFDDFADDVNDVLKEDYGVFMSGQDLNLFFRQLHRHYQELDRVKYGDKQ